MSFNWSNYLIIAKEACEKANGEDPGKEAKYRSAIVEHIMVHYVVREIT